MATTVKADALFALRTLMARHGALISAHHMWVSEHDRWLELVFAIFAATCKAPEDVLRNLVDDLDTVGLLNVSDTPTAGRRQERLRRMLNGRPQGMPTKPVTPPPPTWKKHPAPVRPKHPFRGGTVREGSGMSVRGTFGTPGYQRSIIRGLR